MAKAVSHELDAIVEELGQMHDGGAWHGPSLQEALEGLDAADAARRPIGAAHSIAEIVHHLRVTTDLVRSQLTGKSAGSDPDWPGESKTDEGAWREAVEALRASQRALREAVARLPESRLHDTIPGKEHSYWHELLGLLHHDAYHGGQISLLRKGAGALGVLAAAGRSPEIPESDDVYGWLVGSWDLDVRHYWRDVSSLGWKAEAHFAWVLEGRAVQDVWVMPRVADRAAPIDKTGNMFGTTLRVYDPEIRAWRVTWINPASNARCELIGRRQGQDIVQVGALPDGTPTRWLFTETTPDSFHWTGEALEADGSTWKLQGEFLARRRS
jgi:uncharacterized damage-inducible protein DinB